MRKIALIMAAIVCMQICAFAIPDSMITGPYKVSFDLGIPKDNYTIMVQDPVKREELSGKITTIYQITAQSKIGLLNVATISLLYDPTSAVLPTEDEMDNVINSVISSNDEASNIQATTRKVDGTYGGIASYDQTTISGTRKVYTLVYNPASEGGRTIVMIISTYPWEPETLQLLRTIHVERISGYDIVSETRSTADAKNAISQP